MLLTSCIYFLSGSLTIKLQMKLFRSGNTVPILHGPLWCSLIQERYNNWCCSVNNDFLGLGLWNPLTCTLYGLSIDGLNDTRVNLECDLVRSAVVPFLQIKVLSFLSGKSFHSKTLLNHVNVIWLPHQYCYRCTTSLPIILYICHMIESISTSGREGKIIQCDASFSFLLYIRRWKILFSNTYP